MVKTPTQGPTIGALESLAGFADDLTTLRLDELAAPGALEDAERARFGAHVSMADVTEALEALDGLAPGLARAGDPIPDRIDALDPEDVPGPVPPLAAE